MEGRVSAYSYCGQKAKTSPSVSQGKEMGEVLDPDAHLVPLNRAALRKNAALAISALLEARERRVPPKSQGAK